MKIVAFGLTHNEQDVIGECVTDALTWCDEFVIYDSSIDNTPEIAAAAGAKVILGDPSESFSEQLRQNCLDFINTRWPDTDWVVRIDADEFYPRGAKIEGGILHDPRADIERAHERDDLSLRASVIEFWITLDDVRRGLLLEDEKTSVQKRRLWYTYGHSAVVAWRHKPELYYPVDSMKNVPFDDGGDIGRYAGAPLMLQTHYPCRSLPQLLDRMGHRKRFKKSFGKYQHNLVIDETYAGLFKWDGKQPFRPINNRKFLYKWYEYSQALFKARKL